MKYNNPNITIKQWLTIVLQAHRGGDVNRDCIRLLAGGRSIKLSDSQRKHLALIVASQHQILQMHRHSKIQLIREGEGSTPSLRYTLKDTKATQNLKGFLEKVKRNYFRAGAPSNVEDLDSVLSQCAFATTSDYFFDKRRIPAHQNGDKGEIRITSMQQQITHKIQNKIRESADDREILVLWSRRMRIIQFRELMYLLQAIKAYDENSIPVNITIGALHEKSISYLAESCLGLQLKVINTVGEPLAITDSRIGNPSPPNCTALKEEFSRSFPMYANHPWPQKVKLPEATTQSTEVANQSYLFVMATIVVLVLIYTGLSKGCISNSNKRNSYPSYRKKT